MCSRTKEWRLQASRTSFKSRINCWLVRLAVSSCPSNVNSAARAAAALPGCEHSRNMRVRSRKVSDLPVFREWVARELLAATGRLTPPPLSLAI